MQQKGVTFSLSGGRLGDNLIAFLHALWVATHYDLPLFLTPFEGMESLQLSTLYPLASASDEGMMIVPYFPECLQEREGTFFDVDWQDRTFCKKMVEALAPRIAPKKLEWPQGYKRVALHVRDGGRFECKKRAAQAFPLKFPTDEFYIQKLGVLKGEKIYVHLFTDSIAPQKIIDDYKSKLGFPALFGTNAKNLFESESEEMWHDFYAMGESDVVIRGSSNFSFVAEKLGVARGMV